MVEVACSFWAFIVLLFAPHSDGLLASLYLNFAITAALSGLLECCEDKGVQFKGLDPTVPQLSQLQCKLWLIWGSGSPSEEVPLVIGLNQELSLHSVWCSRKRVTLCVSHSGSLVGPSYGGEWLLCVTLRSTHLSRWPTRTYKNTSPAATACALLPKRF